MKKLLYAVALLTAAFVSASCQKEVQDDKVYEISMTYPKKDIKVNEPATFTDNSLYVKSRTWTFEGGEPATSTEAQVSVVYGKTGKKKVTLEVVYTNGKTDSMEIEVTVTEEIKGEIAVSGLTPLGCAQLGKPITFSIDGMKGDVDKYEWTFPGAEPETSTEASPTVVYKKRDKACKAYCVISRTSDNAYLELETEFIAGNYPIWKANAEYDFDPYSFETSNFGAWILWSGGKRNIGNSSPSIEHTIISIDDNGANGTAHCMKVDLSKLEEVDGDHFSLEFRDCWMTNGYLEVGKTYELDFWVKGVHETAYYGPHKCNLQYWYFKGKLEPGMNIAACMDGTTAGEGYKDVYGIDYPGDSNITVIQQFSMGDGSGYGDGEDNEWANVHIEFTLDEYGVTQNLYNPYLYMYADIYCLKTLWFDELELNLIEE